MNPTPLKLLVTQPSAVYWPLDPLFGKNMATTRGEEGEGGGGFLHSHRFVANYSVCAIAIWFCHSYCLTPKTFG